MSEYSGVEVAATKGNPVVKFAKKKPVIAAALVGGALLLVYLFKPKEDTSASSQPATDPAAGTYPEAGDGSGGSADYTGAIEDIYSQMESLFGALGGLSDENAANMDALSKWVQGSMDEMAGGFNSQLTGALDDVYGQLEDIANQPAPESGLPQNYFNPYSQGAPGPGSYYDPSGGTIKRADLNIPQPATLSVRQQMDIIGDRWGAIYNATGKMDTPEQVALHEMNVQLASKIGGTYDDNSGTYSFSGQPAAAPVVKTAAPAVAAAPSRPAAGVGSNQYNYLKNLEAQGGGNGEWAKAQLAAGAY